MAKLGFLVSDGYLKNIHLTISFEDFTFLTGKSINFEIRNNKEIIVERAKGYIKLFDAEFIEGQSYKRDGVTYKCVCVSKEGHAALEPMNTKLSMGLAKDPEELEIA